MKKNVLSLGLVLAGLSVFAQSLVFETPDLKKSVEVKADSYSVEDPYIVQVDQNGVVTALSGGKTKILAVKGSEKTEIEVEVLEPNREPSADVLDAKNLSGKIDVIMCGDSIMRDYPENEVDQYGLGQAMKCFWDSSKVNVDNSVSMGGRSTRYFYNEKGRWDVVKEKLAENKKNGKPSVVFFSFGHNDQRTINGKDAVLGPYGLSFTFARNNQNGTVAGTHYDYVERYIVETRELGGIPVMVSPYVRNYVKDGAVTEKGRHNHDFIANGEKTPRGNYPEAMKEAAEKHNAIYVDMTSMSAGLVEKAWKLDKADMVYISSDSTHERTFAAFELAKMVTQNLKSRGYFADYIVDAEPKLIVGKTQLNFGRIAPGKSAVEAVDVSAFNIKNCKVTVKAPKNFEVSLSKKENFASEIKFDVGEEEIGQKFFVRFTPEKVKSYSGDLEILSDSVVPEFGNLTNKSKVKKSLKIALAGDGKTVVTGGKKFAVEWKMVKDNKEYFAEASGDVACPKVKLCGLEQIEGILEMPDEEDYIARVNVPGGKWAVNDSGSKVESIYLEYEIPAKKANIYVNKIGFWAGSSGSKNMRWSAYCSTDKKFKNPTKLSVEGSSKYAEMSVAEEAAGLGLEVKKGKSLFVRIYPAVKSTKEDFDTSFMIANVKVEGVSE
ncbi:MAG: Ig-like domain-containing protein [Treponema sp.]|nr:Ig-like domain-containing protein [Candidatus Treponema equifaecale]